ncbi:Putative auto-transporter adhesin, head GIN domain [Pedobacter westerhofensis]|uniref:Auto-transporter adhesin, head GIN domain n=1 Tax=Pedobacter westerhofensis TaxID=425512 RepID=A0A521F2E4_9SPHI|nr:head GIN domain-containing protein [Pedobacter westerhofensis]SMO90226.1 Putative auto-transporter adhesin, head GIN domain [Pedobacter westerhofensis]
MKTLSLIKPAALWLIAMAVGSLNLQAQETKNVAVNNFSEVAVTAGIDLHIIQGTSESARIVADDDVINDVVLEKSGNRIKIGWKENWGIKKMWKNRNAKVYITYKRLNSISASSGSSLITDNTLKTDHLDAAVSSGASMDAKISCNELQLSTNSGASVSIAGTATNMEIKSSSGSSVNALNLATQYARADTNSGADIKINVAKGLETNTSSGSNIRYKGTASLKNTSNSRSSSVSRID